MATIADLAGLSLNSLPFTAGATYTVNRSGAPTPTPPGGSPVRVYLPLARR